MSREEIIGIIAEYLVRQPFVAAAYLFGSAARDYMHVYSDVDIAVLFKAGAGEKPALFDSRLQMEMDYDMASPYLRHQIRKYGKVIVDKEPKLRMTKEVSSLRQYLDMLPVYNYCIDAALRRL